MKLSDIKKEIKYLVSTALEGGSNYWYMIHGHNKKDFTQSPKPALSEIAGLKSGWILINDEVASHDPVTPVKVDRRALVRGLKVMKSKYPRHFVMIEEDCWDAEQADILLQCAIFGEIVYG